MKKRVVSIVLLFVVIGIVLVNVGCNDSVISAYKYENSEKYSVGNTSIESSKINKIDVSWISGKVNIVSSDGNNVDISEEVDEETTDMYRIHYYLDGDILRIKFTESMLKLEYKFIKKELTIKIPKDFVINDLDINIVSCSLEIDSIKANEIEINTVSGNIDVQNTKARELSVDSVSGIVTTEKCSFNEINVDTVSGNVRINNLIILTDLDVNTVSGKILVQIPEESLFKVTFDSISGDLTNEFALLSKADYTYDFETISGDLDIMKLPK